MNTKDIAAIGIGKAIEYYMSQGYSVFIPVSDKERYDLLVDTRVEILRVEVKTTASKIGEVMLRTHGGNQSWGGEVKRINSSDCDRVFCVSLEFNVQKEFTSKELEGRSTIRIK